MSGRGMDAASTRRGRALAILLLLEGAMAHSEYRSRIPNGEVVPGVNALGHANLKGGGMLNAFGKDFKAAGYAWTTELCKKDSDGDGESNGLELGDPCCLWKEGSGVPPSRSWRISHPGMAIKTEGVRVSGVPMPNCSTAAAEVAQRHESLDNRMRADLTTVSSKTFSAFYYTNSFYSANHKQVFTLTAGAQIAIAMIVGFIGLALFEAKHGAPCRPAATVRDGEERRARSWLGLLKLHVALLALAVVYVDVLSGFLHIVLDNPSFTKLPLLGAGAVGFQRHHHHPAGITIHNIFNFVQEHIGGMCGVLFTGLVPARWSAGANTNLLRIFLLEVIVLSCFMMASHRWSHTQESRLSPLVVQLQQSGLLLSHLDHSLHHVDYNCNFAIFTGWCNPFLNRITANLLHERRTAWLGLLGLWAVMPFLVARLFFYRPFLGRSNDGKDAAVELAALKQAPADPYGGDV